MLVIEHLKINSPRNKFELLTEKTKGYVNILLISEIKIDKNFFGSQFKIDGFSNPHRVATLIGGIMLLFMEDLPVNVLLIGKGNESCYVVAILSITTT